MSRSYKKHPYTKDGGPTRVKFAKQEANKKVRRTNDVPNGKSYRRVFEPYDIHDYINYWPWAEAKAWYEGLKYTAAHFTGGVGPMRMYDEDN